MKHLLRALVCLCVCTCLAAPALAEKAAPAPETAARPEEFISGDFEYELDGENAVLSNYLGEETTLTLPIALDGHPVTGIHFLWAANRSEGNVWHIEAYDVPPEHPAFSVWDGVLFDKEGRTLQRYPCARQDKRYRVPDGVTAIGDYAFDVGKMERVDLPKGLLTIGDCAFDGSRLTRLDLPEGFLSLGDDVFRTCLSFERLTIPKSCTHIGTLQLTPFFKELKVAKGNEALELKNGALINRQEQVLIRYMPYAKGAEYVVPRGITAIADYAFVGNKTLERVTLPDGLLTIGDYAFAYCQSLTALKLPEGLISIGDFGFSDTYGLPCLEIPASVSSIGGSAFYSTASLILFVHEGSYAEAYMREQAEIQGRRYAVFPKGSD